VSGTCSLVALGSSCARSWGWLNPYLRINEELFGISIRHDLLRVDGLLKWPKEVFRKVVASQHTRQLDWSSLPA